MPICIEERKFSELESKLRAILAPRLSLSLKCSNLIFLEEISAISLNEKNPLRRINNITMIISKIN
jgi:hypothetical protein